MTDQDYTIIESRQYGVVADDPEDAIKRHFAGESIALTITYQANPRPKGTLIRGEAPNQPGPAPAAQPTSKQKLEVMEQKKADANT